MAGRALSLAFAASVLAGSLCLATSSLWVYGPTCFFPFLGAPLIVGMMALRVALMRRLGVGPEPTSRALEVIALGSMLAPGTGMLIAMGFLRDMPGEHCGLADTARVVTVLGLTWPLWGAGEVLAFVMLARRRAALARLTIYQVAATILALLVAPPLSVLACVATIFETDHGGAGALVLVPVAIAAGSTVVAWTDGRSFASAAALRRVVAVALPLGVGLLLVLPGAPHPGSCTSFWTTTTWGLVSAYGWAAGPCLAAVLYFARDPSPAPSSAH